MGPFWTNGKHFHRRHPKTARYKNSPLQYTEYEKENRIQMWLKLEETDNSLIREKHKPNSEKEKMFIFLAI